MRVLKKALPRAGKIQVVVEGEGGGIAAGLGALAEGIDQHDDQRQDQQEKKNTPAGASSNAVTARECCLSLKIDQAALKRAMISARRGLVSVAAAPNSRGASASAAG